MVTLVATSLGAEGIVITPVNASNMTQGFNVVLNISAGTNLYGGNVFSVSVAGENSLTVDTIAGNATINGAHSYTIDIKGSTNTVYVTNTVTNNVIVNRTVNRTVVIQGNVVYNGTIDFTTCGQIRSDVVNNATVKINVTATEVPCLHAVTTSTLSTGGNYSYTNDSYGNNVSVKVYDPIVNTHINVIVPFGGVYYNSTYNVTARSPPVNNLFSNQSMLETLYSENYNSAGGCAPGELINITDATTNTLISICNELANQKNITATQITSSYAFATGDFNVGFGQAWALSLTAANSTGKSDLVTIAEDSNTIANMENVNNASSLAGRLAAAQNTDTSNGQWFEGIATLAILAYGIPHVIAWNEKKKLRKKRREEGEN